MNNDRQAIQSMLTSIKNNLIREIHGQTEQIDKLEHYIKIVRDQAVKDTIHDIINHPCLDIVEFDTEDDPVVQSMKEVEEWLDVD